MTFIKSDYMYVPFEPRNDADGSVWLKVQAHGNLTALTPYKVIVNEYGYITAALASDTNYYYVGVPAAAISSGEIDWVQIGGYVASMVTPSLSVSVGHGLKIYDGAVADSGADYSGAAGEFAVCYTESSTSTTQNAILVPERIIGTT